MSQCILGKVKHFITGPIALIQLTGTGARECALPHIVELGGSGSMLPKGGFSNLMLCDGFWGDFGPKTSLQAFVIPGMVTEF